MKKVIYSIAAVFAAGILLFTSCKPDDHINPVEGEEITTLLLRVTNGGGFDSTFTYRLRNGFATGTAEVLRADTLDLEEARSYDVSLVVINENKTPHEDITGEINTEKDSHVLLYNSAPLSGPGSIAFSDGSRDNKNNAYNLLGKITTGGRGSGRLHIYLMHQPLNKAGITPDGTGGETDFDASYYVILH